MPSVADVATGQEQSGKTGWRGTAGAVGAILLGIIFLVSGGWKVLDPFKTGELLEQAKVPAGFGTLGAATLGTVELLAAFLLFVPQVRRWGGLLGSALIVFFLGWIGYYYGALVGKECSCFPLIKRSIGPGFFMSDGVMLLMGVVAFVWSAKVVSARLPLKALATLILLAGVSYGVNARMHGNAQVPTPVIVDGKPQNLAEGKVLLFFYDPSCMHCDAAAKFMSKLNWGDTKIVAIPTVNPQWAESFLHDTGLKADTSLELDKLKKAFPFVDPPYGVALVDGQVKETFTQAQFNVPLPQPDLQKLGFVK
jgi:methylamine utilization protein MauE